MNERTLHTHTNNVHHFLIFKAIYLHHKIANLGSNLKVGAKRQELDETKEKKN